MTAARLRLQPALILLLGVAGCSAGPQQYVHLDPLEGEAFVEFDGRLQQRQDAGSSRTVDLEEGIRLEQGGDIIDPRILSFDFAVEPRFMQGFASGPGQQEDLDGLTLGYSGQVSALTGANLSYSFLASAQRTTGDIDGDLGSRTEFTREKRNAQANWHNTMFPMSLKYSEDIIDQTFTSGITRTTSERDDVERSIILSGRSSKMNLYLEHEDFDDRVQERNNDRVTDRARLSHRFAWGKGSSLNSAMYLTDRRGFNESTIATVNENATIRHSDDLSSRLSYAFSASLAEDFESTTHQGGYGLTHQLYSNLTTQFDSRVRHTETDISIEDEYGAEVNLQYNKGIFADGKLALGLTGGYRLTQIESSDGLLRALNESQIVSAAGIARLDQRFVVTGSIVVTDATGQVVFVEGLDYTVVPVAEEFTEINIIPGGQIGFGDTLLITYDFEQVPSSKNASIPFGFGLGLDFGWIAVRHQTSVERQQLLSGPEISRTRDRLDSSTRLDVNWDFERSRATAGAEYRITEIGNLRTDTILLDQTLTRDLARNLFLVARAEESFTDDNQRNIALYRTDMTMDWRPLPNLFVASNLEAFLRQTQDRDNQRGDQTEWFFGAGVDVRWEIRLVRIDFSYDHRRNGGDTTDQVEDRVFLRVTRSF